MNVYLTRPASGSVDVDPLIEILITFEHPDPHREDVFVRVDGEWAVIAGEVTENFTETRCTNIKGVMQWGLRRAGGLPPRDIVVSAWCTPQCSTVEQRFFVRGARKKAMINIPINHNWCRVSGGVFAVSEGRPFPGDIVVHDSGKVDLGNRSVYLPPQVLSDVLDIRRIDGSWALISSDGQDTYLVRPGQIHVFKFESMAVGITDRYLNFQIAPDASGHIPVNYYPSSNETSASDLFRFQHTGAWDMQWRNDISVWHNENEMIVKHESRPMRGISDDILWTQEDLDEPIEDVRIIDKSHVLVNNHLRLNTKTPEIREV